MGLADGVTTLSSMKHWPRCSDILAELLQGERDSKEHLSQAVTKAKPAFC